jgi:hypothetical protein
MSFSSRHRVEECSHLGHLAPPKLFERRDLDDAPSREHG